MKGITGAGLYAKSNDAELIHCVSDQPSCWPRMAPKSMMTSTVAHLIGLGYLHLTEPEFTKEHINNRYRGKDMEDSREFPTLPQQGEDEAIKLIELFKTKLKVAADEVIGDLYSDIMPHIESDSWFNFQNDIMSGFKDYSDRKVRTRYDFKQIRKLILEEYRSELIEDLNQDHLNEIEKLKSRIQHMEHDLY